MAVLNKRAENSKSTYASKLRSAAPTARDNDTERIKACVDARAPTPEIVEEAYRLCHINGYLRKDLRNAKDDLRLADEFKKRQAVREDALEEMREDLLKTQRMLERTWGYMEHRNVKVPADMKAAYNALKTRDLHDWQPQMGMKKNRKQPLQEMKSSDASSKQKQKATKKKKKASEHQTTFLLHTDEGTTRNLRDPVIDSYTDDDTDNEAKSHPNEINDAPSDETLKQLSTPHEQAVENIVAYSEPELPMINPFAKLKIPKVDTAAGEDAKGCGNSTIFVPIVESDWWANKVIAGVKRKNISIDDSTGGAMKKARLDPDLEDFKTGAAGASDRTINSETAVSSGELSQQPIEETGHTTSKVAEVAPTTSEINVDLEEGEIDERELAHDA